MFVIYCAFVRTEMVSFIPHRSLRAIQDSKGPIEFMFNYISHLLRRLSFYRIRMRYKYFLLLRQEIATNQLHIEKHLAFPTIELDSL